MYSGSDTRDTQDSQDVDYTSPSACSLSPLIKSMDQLLSPEAAGSLVSNGDSISGPESRSSVKESVYTDDGDALMTTGYSSGYLEVSKCLEKDKLRRIRTMGEKIKTISVVPYLIKHLQNYYVKRVVSPFEFYLELESSQKAEAERLRHQRMQKSYEKMENFPCRFDIEVKKMMCYAYYDGKSGKWERVRVQDFYTAEDGASHAYIYYCDNGKSEYISCELLRPLMAEFLGNYDTVLLKCYLYDVLPIDGTLNWSLDAMAFFATFVTNQRLGAVTLKHSAHEVMECSADFTNHCGVILTEKVSPNECPHTVNYMMVKMGFARSIGIMSNSRQVLDIPGLNPFFPVVHQKERVKPEETDFERLHRITTEAMASSGPDRSYPIYCETPIRTLTQTQNNYLPFEIRCRLAWIRMSFITGPGKIYIHTRDKKLELKAMEDKLKPISMALPRPSIASLAPGSLVTCDMFEEFYPEESAWARALVLSVEPSQDAVKVLLIDYGNIFLAHSGVVYAFPEEDDKFRSIPSFVHRIHLCDIKPCYNVPFWHYTINDFLFNLLISHEEDVPLYYAHVPYQQDVIKFDEFGQQIHFNGTKWVAEDLPKKSTPDEDVINSMKEDPLLAAHFQSHPIKIYYEIAVEESKFWCFENLSYYLVQREYAHFVQPEMGSDKLHEILGKGFGTL